MIGASSVIQTPKLGYLRSEAFPNTRTRLCFLQRLRSFQPESGRDLATLEFTTLKFGDKLTPSHESLLNTHGDIMVDVENSPNPPGKETSRLASLTSSSSNLKKLNALARVSEVGSDGKLPPHILYLLELGMDLDQIKSITRRLPAFAYYSLEGKIKPVVELLLSLGVNQSDIPALLSKKPHLCRINLPEKLIPRMAYLESLGVEKKNWSKVIFSFPTLLTCTEHKVKSAVDFLSELGLTKDSIGKIFTRCPRIISYSVEENLRPTADYFRSMGVDVAALVQQAPNVFGYSVERNLKPITEFFLDKGYSIEEVGTMVSRFGSLFCYSLLENIIPKWEFFLTMDYPTSELVKFPHYFGYSLEERIKPRYALVRESGVTLYLSQILSVAEPKFKEKLNNKVKKKLDDLGSNMEELKLSFPALSLVERKRCHIVDADDFQTASEVKKKTKKPKRQRSISCSPRTDHV